MAIKAYLVEDQADIRSALVEGMQEVIPVEFIGQAVNEPGAVQWLADNNGAWDVVIVDLFLRNGSGFGVLKACSERPAQQKAVVLTSYVDGDVAAMCRAMGADAVFDKNDQLEDLVKFCLDHAENLGKTKDDEDQTSASTSASDDALASLTLSAIAPKQSRALSKLGRRPPQELPAASKRVPWRSPSGH